MNLIDFTDATDIRSIAAFQADNLFFDKLSHTTGRADSKAVANALIAAGATPAKKTPLFNTGPIVPPSKLTAGDGVAGWTDLHPKQEGMVLINGCVIAQGTALGRNSIQIQSYSLKRHI